MQLTGEVTVRYVMKQLHGLIILSTTMDHSGHYCFIPKTVSKTLADAPLQCMQNNSQKILCGCWPACTHAQCTAINIIFSQHETNHECSENFMSVKISHPTLHEVCIT